MTSRNLTRKLAVAILSFVACLAGVALVALAADIDWANGYPSSPQKMQILGTGSYTLDSGEVILVSKSKFKTRKKGTSNWYSFDLAVQDDPKTWTGQASGSSGDVYEAKAVLEVAKMGQTSTVETEVKEVTVM